MVNESINKLNLIQGNIKKTFADNKKFPQIICVSKTFSIERLKPLIDLGHTHYGENKVQEAIQKWSEIKVINNDIKLHMIGKLQTNKVKKAVKLFDFIHSLDNEKLADVLHKNEMELDKKLSYFIQVNLGAEEQKSGISESNVESFLNYCKEKKNLNVIGLMIIPPNDSNPSEYFKKLKDLNSSLGLSELSMGMSSDYIEAVKYNSTYLRIGSAILGERK